MADFLEEKRQEISRRLKELEPLAQEYDRLKAAASALEDALGSVASEAVSTATAIVTGRPRHHRRRRRPGRPRGSATTAS